LLPDPIHYLLGHHDLALVFLLFESKDHTELLGISVLEVIYMVLNYPEFVISHPVPDHFSVEMCVILGGLNAFLDALFDDMLAVRFQGPEGRYFVDQLVEA